MIELSHNCTFVQTIKQFHEVQSVNTSIACVLRYAFYSDTAMAFMLKPLRSSKGTTYTEC